MKIAIDDSSHTEPPAITMTQVESDCVSNAGPAQSSRLTFWPKLNLVKSRVLRLKTFFHYDRSDGWLVTCKSTTQEMSVRQIDRSLPMVQTYDIYTQTHLNRSNSSVIRNPGFLTLEIIQVGTAFFNSLSWLLFGTIESILIPAIRFP
jgi:hypothetical protein